MKTAGVSLKSLNSFSVDAMAHCVIPIRTEKEIYDFWKKNTRHTSPILILGGGSNVLFLENYEGTVLLNRITGISVQENCDAWYLHVGAGEIWNNLVSSCLRWHIPGLENLALIPGYVGSAPIQNISAYGVELSQFCDYVDVLHLNTGMRQRLSREECRFGYRDSIFKHALRKNCMIIAVGLRLSKSSKPVLTYGDLTLLDPIHTTPKQVYDMVCAMRCAKLPNPILQGNAGSFFKNPIISESAAHCLLNHYPDLPHYFESFGRVKIPAGWLIERCGLKGYCLHGAAVYNKQALILINVNKATGKDIVKLARYVYQKVAERFAIQLEPEVRFIGSGGEINAEEVMT